MKKMAKKIIGLLIVLVISFTSKADWPIGKGRTTLVASYNYFFSSKFFNSNGKLISFTKGDSFKSHFFGLSLLHGLGRRLDLSANLPYIKQDFISGGIPLSNSGVGDISVGLSYHFPSDNFQKHFTIKANFIVPAYTNNKTPNIGYGSKGIQAGLNYSFSPVKGSFCVLEGTYAHYLETNDGPNQYRGAITFGKSLNKYSLVTFNFAHIDSKSSFIGFNPNPQATKNFYSGTLTATYGRKLSRTIIPYIQTFYTLYGSNVGLGMGASLFFIIKIP